MGEVREEEEREVVVEVAFGVVGSAEGTFSDCVGPVG